MSCHSFKTSSTPLHRLFTSKQQQKWAKTNIMFSCVLSSALSMRLPSVYWSQCLLCFNVTYMSNIEAFKAWQHSRKMLRDYILLDQNTKYGEKKVVIKGLISISEKSCKLQQSALIKVPPRLAVGPLTLSSLGKPSIFSQIYEPGSADTSSRPILLHSVSYR